jgi:hypothetical protein
MWWESVFEYVIEVCGPFDECSIPYNEIHEYMT